MAHPATQYAKSYELATTDATNLEARPSDTRKPMVVAAHPWEPFAVEGGRVHWRRMVFTDVTPTKEVIGP